MLRLRVGFGELRSWCAIALSALCACASAAHDGDRNADDGGKHDLVSIGDRSSPGTNSDSGVRGAMSGSSTTDAAEPSQGEFPRWEAHIRRAPFRKLVIEVDVTPGYEPENGVVQDVAHVFKDVLDKPDGVEVVMDGTLEPAGADHAWTRAELNALAAEQLDASAPADVDRIHVLFVDGHDATDGGDGVVLGVAWDHLHIVMFKQSLKAQCDRLLATLNSGLCRGAELSVLTHEMGHVIGLTDNGLPMLSDHRDRAHGHHDADPNSVMYWQYERDSLFDTLLDQLRRGKKPRLELDAHSLEDVRAVRER